jgi:6-pyruvoyltetrahydropterin/6-carboxytetrahydropterin synthase
MKTTYKLSVAREQYKFSCAHMTVFPDGKKERLHGHNYTVAATLLLTDISFANMIAFAPVKAALAELCAEWKERVFVATANPFFKRLDESAGVLAGEYGFSLCGQRYIMPAIDVLELPTDNIAVEPLAAHICARLHQRLATVLAPAHVEGLEVTVEESPGQGASCLLLVR